MQYQRIKQILDAVDGCTFASLDAVTRPCAGIRKEVIGESVILFTNKKGSGYEAMVRRRLEAIGKNPDDFVLSDLPWGERVVNTPFILHRGNFYLQTVLLSPGEARYYLFDKEITAEVAASFMPKKGKPNQGLPEDKSVYVQTYLVDNITRLAAMGEVATDNIEPPDKNKKRPTLKIKL